MTVAIAPKHEYAVLIVCPDGEELIRIHYDGTVEVLKEGVEPEAARVFWNAVEDVFKDGVERLRERASEP